MSCVLNKIVIRELWKIIGKIRLTNTNDNKGEADDIAEQSIFFKYLKYLY